MSNLLKVFYILISGALIASQANASAQVSHSQYGILKEKIDTALDNSKPCPVMTYWEKKNNECKVLFQRICFKNSGNNTKNLSMFCQIDDMDYEEDAEQYVNNQRIYEGYNLYIFENIPEYFTLKKLQLLIGGPAMKDVSQPTYIIGVMDEKGNKNIELLDSEYPLGEMNIPNWSYICAYQSNDECGFVEQLQGEEENIINDFFDTRDYAISVFTNLSNNTKLPLPVGFKLCSFLQIDRDNWIGRRLHSVIESEEEIVHRAMGDGSLTTIPENPSEISTKSLKTPW